jgi:phage terminase large subunit GpA-like protein
MIPSDIQFLLQENGKKPTMEPIHLVSEYAEKNRVLPPDTPFPGFWRNSHTPYSVEIMDNMSPFSPVTEQAVMKAAQLGLSAAAESVIAYWMDENPATILYVSATDKLLDDWSATRLEPLIDSCRFRHKIFAQTENKGSRRTGDKLKSKEFVAGSLNMSSSQSPSGLRSKSIRILIRDEIDGAPILLTTGEGNWLKVSGARTNAFGNRKKIFDISTPTTYEASLINNQYERGDQRKYYVPCPFCGEFQELLFGNETTTYGIKPIRKNDNFVKAVYVCKHCEEQLENYHKKEMLIRGEWRPTRDIDTTIRSYQLSSLYSPPGMFSWSDLWLAYETAQTEPGGIESFVNLCLGLPYKDPGSRPSLSKVIELRGGYRQGTVPDGVLYLTMGVDVQRGSDNDKNYPARLELEILGIGSGYRTYSILYKVFSGAIDDPFEGAWEKLHKWAEETKLIFKRKGGREFQVCMVFIDSGDGMFTDIVYKFCSRWVNTYPSKGFAQLRIKGREKVDLFSPTRDYTRYRASKIGDDTIYQISTNYYKTNVYRNLKIVRKEIGPQRPGFCDFPIDYGANYFKMLTAEEKLRDGSFHCSAGRRNEALDCRVYALCAADVFLDAKVRDVQAAAKEKGATVHDIQLITTRMVIDKMEEALK